jgi:hypothetical protein
MTGSVLITVAAATAAFFSAIATWLTYLAQRRSTWNAVRPDIEIENPAVADTGNAAEVEIRKLTNYGVGPACFIHAQIHVVLPYSNRKALVSGSRIAVLQAGDGERVDWRVAVPWPSGEKASSFNLYLSWRDVLSNRYEATYGFTVRLDNATVHGPQELCKGLYLHFRKVSVASRLRVSIVSWLRNITVPWIHRMKEWFGYKGERQ